MGYTPFSIVLVDENGDVITVDPADTARTTSTNVIPIQIIQADGSVPVIGKFVDENGAEYGVKHVDNKPSVTNTSYLYDIVKGNVADNYSLNKFGHNPTVGADYETIWSGSNIYPYLTTADQLEVLSDDADDTSAGTGARTIKIYGLDSSYDEINESVTMAGAGVQTTTASFLRVFRAEVVTAGASLINEGTITIRDQDTDTTRALIDPNLGQTTMAVWTVPNGYTFYMTSWYLGSSVAKVINIGIWTRDNTVTDASFQNRRFMNFSQSISRFEFEVPIKYTEKTDIEIRANAGGGGGDVSAGFSGWYEAN